MAAPPRQRFALKRKLPTVRYRRYAKIFSIETKIAAPHIDIRAEANIEK